MKQGKNGFTLIGLAVTLAVMSIIGSAAAVATFQVVKSTGRNESHMTAVRQVQNAGYQISHDAQMAESVVVDNLEPPNFLVLNWTEQAYDGGDSTYHSVSYFFEGLSDGIGKLKRNHWSSAGASEETLVAAYIYYDPADPENTSKLTYQSPVLTVRLIALYEEARETREYKVIRRPNLD